MRPLFSSFGETDRARFARQLVLPELGPDGQAALARGSVLIIGAGGLGSPLAHYLAGAGIGRLTIMDPARVALADLHRQTLYGQRDLDASKASAAVRRLREIGGPTVVSGVSSAFRASDARERVRAHDVVVDASDNPATRYLVSDACVLEARPLVFGAVSRLEGQLAVLAGEGEPCYRCLHPEPPPPDSVPACAEVGVLGPVAGVLGSLMAFETMRLLTGMAPDRPRGLLHLDLAFGRSQLVRVPKRDDCPVCGLAPTIREVRLDEAACRAGEPYPGA